MQQIFKQSSYLFFAQIITRIIGFFYTIYLAKSLGVLDFGLFSVSLGYFSIISAISDFGFNRFLIREIAKDKLKAGQLLCTTIMLRLTLAAVFFAIFSVILYSLDPDKMRVSIVLVATMAILPQSVALTFDAIFVALQKLQFSAVSLFISSLSTVATGVYLINNGFGIVGAVNALIFGQIILVISLGLFLYKHQKLVLYSIDISMIKQAVIGSIPYAILSILGLLYFRIDIVLLSYLKGSFDAGIYGVAYKFLEAVTFVPSAFSLALFPILAKIHESSLGNVKKLYFKSLKIMLGLGIVTTAAYLLILPQIINIFLPKYLLSIQAIKVLSLSIFFMFMHTPAVVVLLSTDKYLRQVLILSTSTLIFNISANLIFIPRFGFMGASIVTVLSEAVSFLIFFYLLRVKILNN